MTARRVESEARGWGRRHPRLLLSWEQALGYPAPRGYKSYANRKDLDTDLAVLTDPVLTRTNPAYWKWMAAFHARVVQLGFQDRGVLRVRERFPIPGESLIPAAQLGGAQGFMMNPRGLTPVDGLSTAFERARPKTPKGHLREGYLASGAVHRDGLETFEAILDPVIRRAVEIGDSGPSPFLWDYTTVSGIPTVGESPIAHKERIAYLMLNTARSSELCDAIEKHDIAWLVEHECTPGSQPGLRIQIDSYSVGPDGVYVSKHRIVSTLDGDKAANKDIPTSKEEAHGGPFVERSVLDEFQRATGVRPAASRVRQVVATPAGYSAPLRVVASALREALKDLYPSTFDVRDERFEQGWLDSTVAQRGEILAASVTDVGNHDQAINPALLQMIADKLDDYFRPAIGDLRYAMFAMPLMTRKSERGSYGAFFTASIVDRARWGGAYGNASGDPMTDFIAKAAGVFYVADGLWLFAQSRGLTTLSKRQFVNEFLSGRLPVLLRNLGDNNLLVALDPRWIEFVENPDAWSRYAVLEETPSFGGLVLTYGSGGFAFTRDPFRGITSFLEEDYDARRREKRPFWPLGLRVRPDVYSSVASEYAAYYSALEVSLKEATGLELEAVLERAMSSRLAIPAKLRWLISRDPVAAEIFLTPDKIIWKYPGWLPPKSSGLTLADFGFKGQVFIDPRPMWAAVRVGAKLTGSAPRVYQKAFVTSASLDEVFSSREGFGAPASRPVLTSELEGYGYGA